MKLLLAIQLLICLMIIYIVFSLNVIGKNSMDNARSIDLLELQIIEIINY